MTEPNTGFEKGRKYTVTYYEGINKKTYTGIFERAYYDNDDIMPYFDTEGKLPIEKTIYVVFSSPDNEFESREFELSDISVSNKPKLLNEISRAKVEENIAQKRYSEEDEKNIVSLMKHGTFPLPSLKKKRAKSPSGPKQKSSKKGGKNKKKTHKKRRHLFE